MRKKLIKSQTRDSDLKRPIKKGQNGLSFQSYTPIYQDYNENIPDYDFSKIDAWDPEETTFPFLTVSAPKQDTPRIEEPIKVEEPKVEFKPSKGLSLFNKHFDEVASELPEINQYRNFLTKIAEQESGFNSSIQNQAGAPAYGYFQFMDFNIPNKDVESFRNNPKLQIKSAYNLINQFKKGFNKEDLSAAQQQGYSENALLAGAWLAGNGGVRRFLKGKGNPSDRHWSKEGAGTDVASRMKLFNFKEGGRIKRFQEGGNISPYRKNYLGSMSDKEIDSYINNLGDRADQNIKRTVASTLLNFIPGIGPGASLGYGLNNAIKDYKSKTSFMPETIPTYNWNDFQNEYTRRKINPEYMNYITNKLYNSKRFNDNQILSILGTIVEESGGDPYASDNGKFNGLIQWAPDRYDPKNNPKDPYKAIDYQLEHIYNTLGDLKDGKSWTHGGKGSGYNKAQEAYDQFYSDDSTLDDTQHALNFGFVRPTGKDHSVENRTNAAKTIIRFKK